MARRQFWDLLYDLANRGVTLFVTTHYMEEASHCNQLAFIYGGRLVAEGTPQQIREQATGQRILEVTVANPDAALELIGNLPEVVDAYLSAATVHAVLQPHTDEREVAGSLIDALQSQGHRGCQWFRPSRQSTTRSSASSPRSGQLRVTAECAAAAGGRSRAERRNRDRHVTVGRRSDAAWATGRTVSR